MATGPYPCVAVPFGRRKAGATPSAPRWALPALVHMKPPDRDTVSWPTTCPAHGLRHRMAVLVAGVGIAAVAGSHLATGDTRQAALAALAVAWLLVADADQCPTRAADRDEYPRAHHRADAQGESFSSREFFTRTVPGPV